MLLLLPLLLLLLLAASWPRASPPACEAAAFAGRLEWAAPPAAPLDALAASASASYTVVLNTFRRPALLARSVAHYASCGPAVASIRVVWSEPGAAPPTARSHPHLFPRDPGFVVVDAHRGSTSLNNRFAWPPGSAPPATPGLLSVDDDVRLPCALLAAGFAAWRERPWALVGFWPRLHRPSAAACGGVDYVSSEPALWRAGAYSLVLTKAAFVHAGYLRQYAALPQPLLDYVTRKRECEDLLMAFVVANHTAAQGRGLGSGAGSEGAGGPPFVWVSPGPLVWLLNKLDGLGRGGISKAGGGGVAGHHAARGRCVADFATAFGRNPLPRPPLPLRAWRPGAAAATAGAPG